MKDEDRQRVASVIAANSQPVTLNDLAQRGDRKFRVISMNDTLELIEAVVDDVINKGTADVSQEKRQQFIDEANTQFQQVAKIQAKSQETISQQQEVITAQQAQIERLEEEKHDLKNKYEAQRGEAAEFEQANYQHTQSLDRAREELAQARQREQEAAANVEQISRRLANARETILNYDREIDRLVAQIKDDATLIEKLRVQLHEREHEIGRVKGLMEALHQEVTAARAKSAIEPESIHELRGELVEMKAFLKSLEKQNGHEAPAIEALLQRIAQKEADTKSDAEDRFNSKLSDTLDKIGHAINAATAKPVDSHVDAASVYISKLFDEEGVMESNLSNLDIQATTAKQSISSSLERLKTLRSKASKAVEGDGDTEKK